MGQPEKIFLHPVHLLWTYQTPTSKPFYFTCLFCLSSCNQFHYLLNHSIICQMVAVHNSQCTKRIIFLSLSHGKVQLHINYIFKNRIQGFMVSIEAFHRFALQVYLSTILAPIKCYFNALITAVSIAPSKCTQQLDFALGTLLSTRNHLTGR